MSMSSSLHKNIFVGLMLAIAASEARAAVLFAHQFPTTQTSGYCTSCNGSYREWDQFVLGTRSSITEIEAILHLGSASALNVEYSVWSSDRTVQLFAQSVTPATLTVGSAPFDYNFVSASISGLTLAAGTYYLSIYNGSPTAFLGWVESDVTVHGQSVQSAGAAPLPLSGVGTGRDMAFRVIGEPVPEPSTLLLLVTGLAATGLRRMRQHARHL